MRLLRRNALGIYGVYAASFASGLIVTPLAVHALGKTEYGYQTNPPDRLFGVSYARQAAYLKQSFAIARANPRIDMMLWFLLRDERRLAGWQSGLFTASGRKKPAFAAFQRVR